MAQKAEDLASFWGGSGKRDLASRIRSDSACSCDGSEYGVNPTTSVPIKRNFPTRAEPPPDVWISVVSRAREDRQSISGSWGLGKDKWHLEIAEIGRREIGSDNTHQDAGEIAYLRE
jgi:hypothetical protein